MAVSMQADVAHMAAKLLARRATAVEQIPELLHTLETALQMVRSPRATEHRVDEASALALQPNRLRQPRIRRTAAAETVDQAPSLAAGPPQPRLVRRAEIAPASVAQVSAAPCFGPAQPPGALRGIVRWFDPRTRRGALQLPGFGEDLSIEAGLLEDMGISRLYKGQEIEATLSDDPRPRVVRLRIPGGVWQVHPTGGFVRNRHHARPVVVEMKREALRRVAARVEAEQLLGPSRGR